LTDFFLRCIFFLMRCVKIIFLIVIYVSSAQALQSKDGKLNFILPDNIVEITLDLGLGTYLGDFRRNIEAVGTYTETPVLDLYVSLFIIKYFGLQVFFSSGCVIHPYSKPIEGTILYMGVEIFGQYEYKYLYLKLFAGAGYEHATLLMTIYSSGFFECGTAVGVNVNKWIALINSYKFRMGFLHSIFLRGERLMSLTISLGVVFKIKNYHLASDYI